MEARPNLINKNKSTTLYILSEIMQFYNLDNK